MPVVVNPEVELPPRPGDEDLGPALLERLGLFASLKKTPSFDKFPGSTILRHYRAGEVICRQGDAGASAFYVLTTEDLLALREAQGSALVANLSAAAAELVDLPPQHPARRKATAHLLVDDQQHPRPRGILGAARSWLFGAAQQVAARLPVSIAIDGPSDIDYATRRAPMYEGEVFGEMSCMTLSPRSATVVADSECYLLEFLRNIFDHIQRDAGYQARLAAIYRERVLANHLKRLDILAGVEDADLELLKNRAELVRVEPGQIICDQGDPSDSVYLIRSGLVQVVTDTHVVLRSDDVRDWPALIGRLLEGKNQLPAAAPAAAPEKPVIVEASKPAPAANPLAALKAKAAAAPPPLTPLAHLWQALGEPSRAHCSASADQSIDDQTKSELLSDLNLCLRNRSFLAAKPLAAILDQPEIQTQIQLFPKGTKGLEKDWSDLEVRIGGRLALQALLGEALAPRAAHAGPPRVLAYLARGEIFGEMGVLQNTPRTATCVAYDHPPDPARSSVPVDLVRIDAELFREFVARSPKLARKVADIVKARQESDVRATRERPWSGQRALTASPDFQELGLVQGQKLLLVDLDRCTRCGECVRACINTHDDGHSRLYLDGPRFDRYLVPSACRNCLNPACMIGCPVGSIQRGDDGQILIRDWCIGCGMCADQCPYDSIQMHPLGLIPPRAVAWAITFDGRLPPPAVGIAPFDWNLELQSLLCVGGNTDRYSTLPLPVGEGRGEGVTENLGATLNLPLRFCYGFEAPAAARSSDAHHQLSLVTQGTAAEVWLNEQPLTLACEEKQRRGENKKLQCEAVVPGKNLRAKNNLIEVRISPPVAAGDCVLELSLSAAPRQVSVGAENMAEVRQVQERAVVCDLCSSLSTGPACVTMCPHEAAIRVDARVAFGGA